MLCKYTKNLATTYLLSQQSTKICLAVQTRFFYILTPFGHRQILRINLYPKPYTLNPN